MIDAGAARPARTETFEIWPMLSWDEAEEAEALIPQLRAAGLDVDVMVSYPNDGRGPTAIRVRDPGRVPCITALVGVAHIRITFEPWHVRYDDSPGALRFASPADLERETMDDIRRIHALTKGTPWPRSSTA